MPSATLFAQPIHPYTQGPLGALQSLEWPRHRLVAIPGSVPEPSALPPGCAFAPRCPQVRAACAADPADIWAAPDHRAACVLARVNTFASPSPAGGRRSE